MANLLTDKQKIFTANYIRGMSGTQAAKTAYTTTSINSAAVIAYENLRKPKIIAEIHSAFEKYDLVQSAVNVLKNGMEATKPHSSMKLLVPDHAIRLKAESISINLWFIGHGEKPLL